MIAASSSVSPMSSPKTYSAGTSLQSAFAKRRSTVSLSGKAGSKRIPALAPPNRRSTAAHFHVITRARRATSVMVRVGLIRVPPLPIPRAVLSMTRAPRMPAFGSATVTTFSGPQSSAKEKSAIIRVCSYKAPAVRRRRVRFGDASGRLGDGYGRRGGFRSAFHDRGQEKSTPWAKGSSRE
jgi:hypothetical protein